MALEEQTLLDRLTAIEIELQKIRRQSNANLEVDQRRTKGLATIIRGIVPVISSDADIPAEVYYAHFGADCQPEWVGILSGVSSVGTWDATDERLYLRFPDANGFIYGNRRFAWPEGPYGAAHSFEPKQSNAKRFVMEFRARFNANADYTTSGIGLLSRTPSVSTLFGTATDHFIQVLRNAGAWELGTCNGTTISQSSGGTGDGNFHDFKVTWRPASVELAVDGTTVITKTTNLPAQALSPAMVGHATAGTFDITAVSMTWEEN